MPSVKLKSEHLRCQICSQKYTSDMESTNQEIRSRLPVMSASNTKWCDHYFCYGCILKQQQKEAAEKPKTPKWISCLSCRTKTAFCCSQPKFHRVLIDLLDRAQIDHDDDEDSDDDDDEASVALHHNLPVSSGVQAKAEDDSVGIMEHTDGSSSSRQESEEKEEQEHQQEFIRESKRPRRAKIEFNDEEVSPMGEPITTTTGDAEVEASSTGRRINFPVGTRLLKESRMFHGEVIAIPDPSTANADFFKVRFSDGDMEDYELYELLSIAVHQDGGKSRGRGRRKTTRTHSLLGMRVMKEFEMPFEATVIDVPKRGSSIYRIRYDYDEEEEEVEARDLAPLVIAFDEMDGNDKKKTWTLQRKIRSSRSNNRDPAFLRLM